MTVENIRRFLDQGGLLLNAPPSAVAKSVKDLVGEIHEWLAEVDGLECENGAARFLPALNFLQTELRKKVAVLSQLKEEE